MWKTFLLLWFACVVLRENGAPTPAIKPQSMRGIIFPSVDRYDECFVDGVGRRVKGKCKNLSECPSAVERWQNENIRPETCYFNKFDHIVCCEIEKAPVIEPEVYTPPPDVKRRSEMECDGYHVFKISVVNGEPTSPKEFPYMVSLGWKSNFDNSIFYRCGGVLISSTFFLTAAHCVELGGDPPVVGRIGGVNLTDPSVRDVQIKQIIVHPGYNVSSSYNDIALVELENAVTETPACVWSRNDVDHNNVTALGYGHTRFAGSTSDQLLKASLFLVSNEICQTYYPPDPQILQMGVASTHICAGDPENLRDTCQGDSGGPIIMKVERDVLYSYVVGITSFGQGCAGAPPSIYTRTSSYIDWIEDIVWPSPKINLRVKK